MENDLLGCMCLHGFMGSTDDWNPVTAHLSGDLDAFAVSLESVFEKLPPGSVHFEGMLRALAQRLKTGPDLLMGYSMGGRLALGAALTGAVSLHGLVLISATPGMAQGECRDTRLAGDRQWAERLAAEPLDALLADWYKQPVFDSLRKKPGLLESLIRGKQGKSGPLLAHMLNALGTGNQPDYRPELRKLDIPVLLICGQKDPKFISLAAEMHELLPYSSLCVIEDAGHMPHLENPKEVAESIRSFIGKFGF